jgi:hypothetical protein
VWTAGAQRTAHCPLHNFARFTDESGLLHNKIPKLCSQTRCLIMLQTGITQCYSHAAFSYRIVTAVSGAFVHPSFPARMCFRPHGMQPLNAACNILRSPDGQLRRFRRDTRGMFGCSAYQTAWRSPQRACALGVYIAPEHQRIRHFAVKPPSVLANTRRCGLALTSWCASPSCLAFTGIHRRRCVSTSL